MFQRTVNKVNHSLPALWPFSVCDHLFSHTPSPPSQARHSKAPIQLLYLLRVKGPWVMHSPVCHVWDGSSQSSDEVSFSSHIQCADVIGKSLCATKTLILKREKWETHCNRWSTEASKVPSSSSQRSLPGQPIWLPTGSPLQQLCHYPLSSAMTSKLVFESTPSLGIVFRGDLLLVEIWKPESCFSDQINKLVLFRPAFWKLISSVFLQALGFLLPVSSL